MKPFRRILVFVSLFIVLPIYLYSRQNGGYSISYNKIATTTSPGIVQPDGTTITVTAAGIITAAGSSGSGNNATVGPGIQIITNGALITISISNTYGVAITNAQNLMGTAITNGYVIMGVAITNLANGIGTATTNGYVLMGTAITNFVNTQTTSVTNGYNLLGTAITNYIAALNFSAINGNVAASQLPSAALTNSMVGNVALTANLTVGALNVTNNATNGQLYVSGQNSSTISVFGANHQLVSGAIDGTLVLNNNALSAAIMGTAVTNGYQAFANLIGTTISNVFSSLTVLALQGTAITNWANATFATQAGGSGVSSFSGLTGAITILGSQLAMSGQQLTASPMGTAITNGYTVFANLIGTTISNAYQTALSGLTGYSTSGYVLSTTGSALQFVAQSAGGSGIPTLNGTGTNLYVTNGLGYSNLTWGITNGPTGQTNTGTNYFTQQVGLGAGTFQIGSLSGTSINVAPSNGVGTWQGTFQSSNLVFYPGPPTVSLCLTTAVSVISSGFVSGSIGPGVYVYPGSSDNACQVLLSNSTFHATTNTYGNILLTNSFKFPRSGTNYVVMVGPFAYTSQLAALNPQTYVPYGAFIATNQTTTSFMLEATGAGTVLPSGDVIGLQWTVSGQ